MLEGRAQRQGSSS